MDPDILTELCGRRKAICERWNFLLRSELAPAGSAAPDALLHLVPESLRAVVRRLEKRRDSSRRPPPASGGEPADPATVTAPRPPPPDLACAARRTVACVIAMTDHFTTGGQHGVNLRIAVCGVELGVRVELSGGRVHTTFRTDSRELQLALADAWHSAAPCGDRHRLTMPVFTSGLRPGESAADSRMHREPIRTAPPPPATDEFFVALDLARAVPIPACRCGRNPYEAYFAAGERALFEEMQLLQASLPAHRRSEADVAAVVGATRQLAASTIETYCSVCVHRAASLGCRFAPEAGPEDCVAANHARIPIQEAEPAASAQRR